MSDQSSGRDASTNSGSDSAVHHGKGSAYEQHSRTPKAGPAVPTVAPNGSAMRELKPFPVPGSAAK